MNPIQQFLEDRKAAWLKAKGKDAANEEAMVELQQQANERFALPSWLPDAAKRASQLSIVSHPGKFSHPSAKTSSIIAKARPKADGYLRTGNLSYPLDVFGNAAAMDVYKFLSVAMPDGKTVLEHLEADTEAIKEILSVPTESYSTLKESFLSVKNTDEKKPLSDPLVKQVYFPVGNNQYHLLSLLTPSGVITKLKSTLDTMRFSDDTKAARENRKKGLLNEAGFDDVPNLTVTAYGGTQPQNVSVLNSQNAGRAYLLLSVPPSIQARNIRLPRYDFFAESLGGLFYKKPSAPTNLMKENLLDLQRFMKLDINNIKIRTAIHNIVAYGMGLVFAEVEKIRKHPPGWSSTEHYQGLDADHKVLLDNDRAQERDGNREWQARLSTSFARWYLDVYKKTLAENVIDLGDGELRHIKDIVLEVANEEGLWV